MKDTALHSFSTTPRNSARTRRTALKPDAYVPASAVRDLLAHSLDARQQRLGAADMISTDDAARLVDTTRVTINAWIAKGRAIGLTQTKRGFRMPRWQFEPAMWAAIPKLSAALGTTEGWALLSFLESPHGALEGLTPRQAIEQGRAEQAIAIAEHEGN
ncbi:MAG: hypothetical protein AB7U92_15040 [Piscinibacter sp.]|jgi:hypothetical protein|uniref:hypothetical protein n=1 Tax=Piscinibacter sp. TaxID=1903157 RepID=UPI0011D73B4C|nr:MAG: hypothetical protein E6Q93_28170 [Burkholderiaceae bacterium]